jgi:hypothetical protein
MLRQILDARSFEIAFPQIDVHLAPSFEAQASRALASLGASIGERDGGRPST